MASFYIDTSALVKRYRSENGSCTIDALYSRVNKTGERILTSYLSVLEFSSTIMRLQRQKVIHFNEAMSLMDLFQRESEVNVGYWPVSHPLLNEALRMVLDHPIRTPDAIQLASAKEAFDFLKPTQKNFYFIADDKSLCNVAEEEGLTVIRPRDENAMTLIHSINS